ncbi:MAG: RNA polymerase Rpb5, C-terminal domain-containing protein [Piptocephalis tieghemiana]|nr:MAG: RNA polymerase Rpb5, C-terminal domain-containing protein [Piptocephalis tieghemiana]
METDEKEIVSLWKVMRTIYQIASDRGYLVSQSDYDLSYEQFRSEHARNGAVDRAGLMVLATKRDDPLESLQVAFAEETSVGIKTARKICERMILQGVRRGIIVYQQSMTPSASKVVTATARKVEVEVFSESELLVNVTHHTLVPKHIVLSEAEKATLLQRYRLQESQLPRIQSIDPVARYFGLKRGQVVKIVRPSETAGRYLTYRLCM